MSAARRAQIIGLRGPAAQIKSAQSAIISNQPQK
jgi:hypothetical protein